jgi:hypothetical protein
MASTYSALKIELIGTGDQAGTWGATTNTNLGTALEEAITGSANVTFTSANAAITLTDTNATQTARNLRLNLVGTISTTQHLFIPAIEKQYIVNNNLTSPVIVANGSNTGATGTTIRIPASSSVVIFNDGVNVSPTAVAFPINSNLTFKLPTADGTSGQLLQTDGAGNLSFTTVSGVTTGKAIAMAMIFGF